MKTLLPPSLLALVLAALPLLSAASPQPPLLVSDDYLHLMPRNTLFFRQASNLQTFTGNLGGFSASPITNSGDAKRPFSVDGNTFTDFQTAAQRTCDDQFQKCSQAANEAGNKGAFKVADCDSQKGELLVGSWSGKGRADDCGQASVIARSRVRRSRTLLRVWRRRILGPTRSFRIST